jgi:hypothetical protein
MLGKMILRTMTLSMMMPCLSINNARTLRIMTLRMMTFCLLTNNIGQNDTYNNNTQLDVIQHIAKQCWAIDTINTV